MKKRILGSLPLLIMLLILLPVPAFAAEKPVEQAALWVEFDTWPAVGSSSLVLAASEGARGTPQEKWIDRVDLSGEADDLYDWLVKETGPDGILTKVLPDSYKVTGSSGTFYRKKVFEYTSTYSGSGDETWKNKFHSEYSPEIQAVLDAFDRDHPEVFWLNRGSGGITIQAGMTAVSGTATVSVYLDFTNIYKAPYSNTPEGIDRLAQDIAARDRQIAAIKQEADAETTRRGKIEAVSAWLTANNDYYYESGKTPADAPNTAHDCLGALKGQKLANGPVCEGYAKAFKAVCDKLEIPCVLVDGSANSAGNPQPTDGHMWNYVQMEDGKWSAVDVTWNDPVFANSSGVNGTGTQNYTLVGAGTVVDGMAFRATHSAANKPSDNASGLFMTNAPVLREEAYADVEGAIVTGITITGDLTKTDYTHGRFFNPDGITVTANYADGSKKDVTDQAVFNENKPLTAGQTFVKATFQGKEAFIPGITVIKKEISFSPVWSESTFTYDGTEKTVTVTGAPATVSTSYTNNTGTNAGTYNAVATFSLAAGYSADHYDLTVTTSNVTLTINRATPTGAPTCAPITADGKTLADAPLSKGTLTPGDGTLVWALGNSTKAVLGTAYQWTFTPADSTNYSELTGQLIPYSHTDPTPTPPGEGSDESGSPSGSTGTGSGESGSSSGSTGTGSGESGSSSGPADPGTQGGGQTAQTTVKPSAQVSGSSASAALSLSAGSEIVSRAVRDNSEAVVISPSIRDSVTSTQVTIPAATVGELGRRTSADVVVDTPVAQVAIPNGALSGLGKGDLTVSAGRQGSTLSVTVQSGSQTVDTVSGGLTVTAPVSPDAPSGTVAVLVNSDGSREIIRKSIALDGTISIPLEGSARVEIVDNSKTFHDVPSSSWAYGAVSFASSHELFVGTGENSFSPDISMTRGMVAMVLYNLENNPDTGLDNQFSDVADGAWYAEAVSWAAQEGIVYGYPDGSFGSGNGVTREQLAVMLYRYAGSPGADAGSADRFSDASSISAYAREAMDWAVTNGIVNGIGGNQLAPKGQATRAQVAQMLKNYLESQVS